MEKLKTLEEICQPDVRYSNRVDLNKVTGAISETTVQSIYRLVEPIELSKGVPSEVRSHFEIAKNLVLYSWFVYSFNIVAAMQAYASLEMAVRIKTGDRKTRFKILLDGVFKGHKFVGDFGPPMDVSIAVSRLRNDLAHGRPTLHGQGVDVLRTCAQLINQLFP